MSQKVREEMLPRLRQRYVNRDREGRSRMIDELCEQFGYSRKHAIKLLIRHWYDNPSAVIVGSISKEVEFAADALIRSLGTGFYADV